MDRYTQLMEQAQRWITAHRDEFVSELQSWARVPSVSRADLAVPGAPFGPDCRRMLDHAMTRGQQYGFHVTNHDGYACSISMGCQDSCIGIVAHLDVVPEGEGWVYPPWNATWLAEHDAVIGRGVDDNKGSAIAGLFAMRFLKEAGWPLKHGICLLCGTSEETGMQDMRELRARGMKFPDISLVPDAGFPVNYAQKGGIDATLVFPCQGNLLSFSAGSAPNIIPDAARCVIAADPAAVRDAFAALDETLTAPLTVIECPEGVCIQAAGRAGHAAFPAGGDSAIAHLSAALAASGLLEGSCAGAILAVADLTSDAYGRSEAAACRDEESGELTLVYGVARLEGGLLSLSADCRYPVTADGQALEKQLRAAWEARGATVTDFDRSDPFFIPRDDPAVKTLQTVYKAATGRDDPPFAMGGGTYSRAVPRAISFGPGMPGKKYDRSFLPPGHGMYHGPDETVFMEKLHDCCRIYVGAIAALDDLMAGTDNEGK